MKILADILNFRPVQKQERFGKILKSRERVRTDQYFARNRALKIFAIEFVCCSYTIDLCFLSANHLVKVRAVTSL